MPDLKLARLPDRTPVKMTIRLPYLADALPHYAAAHGQAYGKAESVADIIPFMLASFIDSDRGFVRKARR